jgi:hypothetical protein
MALSASEVDMLQTSTVGWIVIAIAWSIIEALRLAGSFLTAKAASQSTGQTKVPLEAHIT